jgi:hypothetical protein
LAAGVFFAPDSKAVSTLRSATAPKKDGDFRFAFFLLPSPRSRR